MSLIDDSPTAERRPEGAPPGRDHETPDLPPAATAAATAAAVTPGPRVGLIGNAHIDPVWIWDWHEGLHEVLQTFRAALERLAGHPDLTFSASSAAQYEWLELVDPELFEQVRAAVASGRWIVTGGQWVEPDCAIPSGESVCRQLLYGQRYFASRFGSPARIGYNIDSFGHAGSLPQLLARSGLEAYLIMRPGEDEFAIPRRAFMWEGVDGTRLPTYRIPFDYSSRGDESALIPERVAALLASTEEPGSPPVLAFFGVGDHGGGPTRRAMALIDELVERHPADVGYSDPHRYFQQLRAFERELPVVNGDLHWHAVGCYSAYHRAKESNARAERALLTAEAMAETCRQFTGLDLGAQAVIEAAWHDVLFNQFHDSLGGTCTETAYRTLDRMVDGAIAAADRLTTRATHAVVQQIDTWTEGAETAEGIESAIAGLPVPLVVFNPLSWPIHGSVTIPHPLPVAWRDSGSRTNIQLIASGEETYSPVRALVEVDVPPMGWQLYWLRIEEPTSAPAAQPPASEVRVGDGELANSAVSARIDLETGAITSLRDSATGAEWLAGPLVPVILEDPSDTWSHGVSRYEGDEQVPSLVSWRLTEEGPVRATYRLEFSWRSSTIVEEVSCAAGGSGLELRFELDWHEAKQLVKLVVPTSLADPQSVAGLPYGTITREPHGHEEVMARCVEVTGTTADAPGGLACTSDYTYAYDLLGPRLRLTLLRSPRYADHGEGWGGDDFVSYPVMNQGRSRLSIRLHPHAGPPSPGRLLRLAEEHVTDLPLVLDTWHPGRLARSASLVEVSTDAVTVPVVKRSEDGAGVVLRVVEASGSPARATVAIGPANEREREISVELGAHEVKTLYVPDEPTAALRELGIPELDLS